MARPHRDRRRRFWPSLERLEERATTVETLHVLMQPLGAFALAQTLPPPILTRQPTRPA
jgi:hypothetical protein